MYGPTNSVGLIREMDYGNRPEFLGAIGSAVGSIFGSRGKKNNAAPPQPQTQPQGTSLGPITQSQTVTFAPPDPRNNYTSTVDSALALRSLDTFDDQLPLFLTIGAIAAVGIIALVALRK